MALSLNKKKSKSLKLKKRDKLLLQEIMMRFKRGKTQVYNTLTQKYKIMNEWLQYKIMNEWLQGNGRMKRKAKVTGNEEIN
jgi:hypothetical protein